jgi:hypothetical protein
MTKYILPFTETMRGWYEIEASTIEEARAIATRADFTENTEANYRDGEINWDESQIKESEEND